MTPQFLITHSCMYSCTGLLVRICTWLHLRCLESTHRYGHNRCAGQAPIKSSNSAGFIDQRCLVCRPLSCRRSVAASGQSKEVIGSERAIRLVQSNRLGGMQFKAFGLHTATVSAICSLERLLTTYLPGSFLNEMEALPQKNGSICFRDC